MDRVAVIVVASACWSLSACTPGEGQRPDSNLECSALISAATYLAQAGKVEVEPAFTRRAVASSMGHLNAYAIPAKLKEREAINEVKALRKTLIESVKPEDILTRARRCMDRSPI